MTIDTATYDNGNNDECGTPLSVNDRAEFAIMAPHYIVASKHFHCRQMNVDALQLHNYSVLRGCKVKKIIFVL